MPVKFKGDSEYDSHYKWLESPKSVTFSPSRQQAAPIAGLSSPNVSLTQGFMDEPAILRKKKPIPLVMTSTTKMYDEDMVVPDDYMLLGSQEKFTPNIPYKDYLTKNRTRVLGTTFVTPAKPADFEELQPSPKKELARINFDTGAPRSRDEKGRTRDEAVQVVGTAKPMNLSKTRVIAKEPTSPVSVSSDLSSGSARGMIAAAGKTVVVDKPRVTQPISSANEPAKSHAAVYSQPARVSAERAGRIPRQDQNVDSSYAMKYRAGISPKRSNPKRKSEYEYKYEWKKPIDSTPLLAAEQVVHNRNPQVAPYKGATPKSSEYRKEFKAWKYKPVSKDDSKAQPAKKSLRGSQMRRARSASDLTPDRRPAAGSPSRIHHDNSRLTQSLNPQKPFFPHRRTVSWTTEYASNYQSFTKYEYDQGAWKGAAPPHVRQQMIVEPDTNINSSNWIEEVAELREKAEEYRKRSNGTHFSRAHVAQLLSANSKLWDAASVSSDLSALDLEQSALSNRNKSEGRQKEKKIRQRTQSAQAGLRSLTVDEGVQTRDRSQTGARKRLALSSDGERSTSPSDSTRSICSASDPTMSSFNGSYKPPKKSDGAKVMRATASEESDKGSKGTESTANGRVQTPELASSPVAHRHHLDITTPNRHGLLLSSPPHRKTSSQSGGISKPQFNRTVNNALEVKVPATTDVVSKSLISPTYGKPTPDTHCLLNEDVAEPVDVILETRYVQSPQPKDRGKTYIAQDKRGDPWNYHREKRRDVDECSETSQISNSMMSVISSTSSLASEVLERAAQRQQFWKKAKA